MSESTKPFQVVTGSNIVPQQPFAHLYQHIRQRDPKLAETIDRLAQPAALNNNLSNPLQGIEFVFLDPLPSDKTNWVNVLSNVATDESLYYPLIAYANVTASSSTDIELDIQISHDGGLNFISILANLIIIPAGDLIMTKPLITFTQGAYLRNLDLVYAQLTSSAFDGGSITLELLFQ